MGNSFTQLSEFVQDVLLIRCRHVCYKLLCMPTNVCCVDIQMFLSWGEGAPGCTVSQTTITSAPIAYHIKITLVTSAPWKDLKAPQSLAPVHVNLINTH